MINAIDAKKRAMECDISEELECIEGWIKEATKDGEMNCYLPVDFIIILSDIKRKKIINVLEKNGYEIKGRMISWARIDEKEWIEKQMRKYDDLFGKNIFDDDGDSLGRR